MKLFVCSRTVAKNFESDKPWAAISICEDPTQFPQLSENNRQALLQVEFADAEFNRPGTTLKIFDEADAEKILAFVDQLPPVETLMVHCGMGISRSAAVAAALSKIATNDDTEYFNEPYSPNSKVYHTMLKTAFDTGRYKC